MARRGEGATFGPFRERRRSDGQARLFNGIFAALSSSLEIDDLKLILLTILSRPRGLGFTRAHLFLAGEAPNSFEGALGLGCPSRAHLRRLSKEIAAEDAMLVQMAASRRQGRDAGGLRTGLNDLRGQTWWITAYQEAEAENPLTKAVRGRPLLRESVRKLPQFLRPAGLEQIRALRVKGSKIPSPLNPETVKYLGDDFLLGPLRTKRGVSAVVAVDRAFQPDGITPENVMAFEWLCNQASLALQNAELFSDLRRTYDELEAVDRMKSNFLSVVSHELRTPLTSILGFVQLIRDGRCGEINPAMHRLLDKVVGKSQDLARLINDLLEIAELQSEALINLDLEPVALDEAVDEAIQHEEHRSADRSVRIVHRRPKRELPLVMGDSRALERLAYHLIDNGVKFNDGGGSVTIDYRATAKHVDLRVRDTGKGMSQEECRRIYEDFYQGDGNLTRKHGGVGLGLTIVKKLMHLLNGEIQVESELGKGTTIRLRLPVAPTEDPAGNAARG
jgi:signal transduction histidine kinase